MRTKLIYYLVAMLAAMIVFNACGSSKEQVKEEPKEPEPKVKARTEEGPQKEPEPVKVDPAEVRAANQKLADELSKKLTTAVMTGFANARVQLPAKKETAWVKKNVPLFQEVTAALPDALAIEVEGHASSNVVKNPKHAVITRADASLQRAEYAIAVLEKNGVDTAKMTAVGKSDSEPLPGKNPKDGANRRVTFKVIVKE